MTKIVTVNSEATKDTSLLKRLGSIAIQLSIYRGASSSMTLLNVAKSSKKCTFALEESFLLEGLQYWRALVDYLLAAHSFCFRTGSK